MQAQNPLKTRTGPFLDKLYAVTVRLLHTHKLALGRLEVLIEAYCLPTSQAKKQRFDTLLFRKKISHKRLQALARRRLAHKGSLGQLRDPVLIYLLGVRLLSFQLYLDL
jgi:hypothetical protein